MRIAHLDRVYRQKGDRGWKAWLNQPEPTRLIQQRKPPVHPAAPALAKSLCQWQWQCQWQCTAGP
eukprot:354671-Chlamydomonas_euryale.AAC.1